MSKQKASANVFGEIYHPPHTSFHITLVLLIKLCFSPCSVDKVGGIARVVFINFYGEAVSFGKSGIGPS